MSVLQKSAELFGEQETLDLSGNSLDMPAAIPGYIGDPVQLSQDTPLLGVAPQCYLRYAMNAAGRNYVLRKTQMWYDSPTRSTKPQPVDE